MTKLCEIQTWIPKSLYMLVQFLHKPGVICPHIPLDFMFTHKPSVLTLCSYILPSFIHCPYLNITLSSISAQALPNLRMVAATVRQREHFFFFEFHYFALLHLCGNSWSLSTQGNWKEMGSSHKNVLLLVGEPTAFSIINEYVSLPS
jgi:hypothetical protein